MAELGAPNATQHSLLGFRVGDYPGVVSPTGADRVANCRLYG
jgi:hypothetical protein